MSNEETPASKLKRTLELADFGLRMKRTELRRDHPSATNEQLDALYFAWLFADESDLDFAARVEQAFKQHHP